MARSSPATRRAGGLRREAHQRVAGHPRPGQIPRASPAGATSPRCCRASTPRKRAGLKVKINTVALKGVNEDEIETLLDMGARPRHGPDADRGHAARARSTASASTSTCRSRWCARASRNRYTLEEIDDRTGGPARYVRVAETGGTLGFITPMTHNFCESCNRVRLTCTGQLFMCLGQEDAADLRAPVRASESNERSSRPSTTPSRASPRATISSSTAATPGRR